MKQTCQQCKWYYEDPEVYRVPIHQHACFYNSKWTKWLKKDSADKPNNCDKFSI